MEVTFKNVGPEDFILLKKLSQRLGIEVEEKEETVIEPPDNLSVAEDLREAIAEIKLDLTYKKPLRDAWEFINEL